MSDISVINILKRDVVLRINNNEVKQDAKKILNKYAKNAKIDGFRKGKIPEKLKEQIYGNDSYQDALRDMINKKFQELTHDVSIVGDVSFEKQEVEGNEIVVFISFEVMPEIVFNIENKPLKRLECSITAEDVHNTMATILKKLSRYEVVDRPATSADKVNVDYAAYISAKLVDGAHGTNTEFALGENGLLPEFEECVIGMSAGQEKGVQVTFPDNYHAGHLQGKTALFKIKLNSVLEYNLMTEEEFCNRLGETFDPESFHKHLYDDLTETSAVKLHGANTVAMIKFLSDNATVSAIPDGLVKEFLENNTPTEESAEYIIKQRLVLSEFMDKHNITVNNNEVKEGLKKITLHDLTDEQKLTICKTMILQNKVLHEVSKVANVEIVNVKLNEVDSFL